MNIQIWGRSKCFDTKKAERWFKERRIKYQYTDLLRYGISKRELQSVKNAVGLVHALEKEMATHSSVLAWRIPGTGEPGGLPSMGSHRVGHD